MLPVAMPTVTHAPPRDRVVQDREAGNKKLIIKLSVNKTKTTIYNKGW